MKREGCLSEREITQYLDGVSMHESEIKHHLLSCNNCQSRVDVRIAKHKTYIKEFRSYLKDILEKRSL